MSRTIQVPATLTFHIGGQDFTLATADMTEEALLGLLHYGKRKANDTFNSAKGGDKPLTPAEVMAKIQSWDFGTSGPRVDAFTKALREIVKGYLGQAGFKAKDAQAKAQNPEEGFKEALRYIMAAKQKIPAANVAPEELAEAFAKNWPKVEKQAQTIVDQAKGQDLEI